MDSKLLLLFTLIHSTLAFVCPPSKDGQYLHANTFDCGKFWMCSSDGKAHEMTCPAGLHWNSNHNYCDWPANANCQVNNVPLGGGHPENPTPPETTQSPPQQSFECPLLPPGEDCNGPEECIHYAGKYPHQNCSKYWECTDDGRPFERDCPGGLQWNDNLKVCDWPESSTCGQSGGTQPPETTQPPPPETTPPPQETSPQPPEQTTEGEETTGEPTEPPSGTSSSTALICSTSPATTPSTTTLGAPDIFFFEESDERELDLKALCGSANVTHLLANPFSVQRYIECHGGPNGESMVRTCSPGLLFDEKRITCDYSGYVKMNKHH